MEHRLSRRSFLRTTGGAAAALAAGQAGVGELLADEEINVLFLMTDQQHHLALGAAGNPLIHTPNLDRLAGQGALFTNAICATPFCSPTRAALITGQCPHRLGIEANVQAREKGARDEWVSTENLLFDAGYTTHHRGKWHLGPKTDLRCYREDVDPAPNYGQYLRDNVPFSSIKGHTELWGRPVRMLPSLVKAREAWLQMKNIPKQDLSIIGEVLLPPEHMQQSWITDKVLDLLDQHGRERFMITWSVSDPHAYWVTPEPYYSMYSRDEVPVPESVDNVHEHLKTSAPWRLGDVEGLEGIREYIAVYYGMVSLVDWNVGRILDKLDELGVADRTLVIFTSDHGDMQGAHGMIGKSVPAFYEEIARVPLIMRLPGRIPAGKRIRAHANSVDLMPTILDYVGLPIPQDIDGRSLRPVIEGEKSGRRWRGHCERALGAKHFGRMIRANRWKYVFNSPWPNELYDLENDPGEMVNLIEEPKHKAQARRLHRELRQWMAETHDPHLPEVPEAL